MVDKIKVQIYGIYDEPVLIGCSSKVNSCSSCGSHGNNVVGKSSGCHGCDDCKTNDKRQESNGYRTLNTIGKAYEDLTTFIKNTDVSANTELEFIDISKTRLEEDSDIKSLIERGFEQPFTVIDGIVRFYGGMSGIPVYKDIKELLNNDGKTTI
jgi:hypothetical protein